MIIDHVDTDCERMHHEIYPSLKKFIHFFLTFYITSKWMRQTYSLKMDILHLNVFRTMHEPAMGETFISKPMDKIMESIRIKLPKQVL